MYRSRSESCSRGRATSKLNLNELFDIIYICTEIPDTESSVVTSFSECKQRDTIFVRFSTRNRAFEH